MNPIGFLTWHLSRTVSLGDVSSNFFIKRRMSYRAIYGPGVIVPTDGVDISDCFFANCDFVVVPPGMMSFSGPEMRDCKIRKVRFQKITFLSTETFADLVRKAMKSDYEINVIHAKPSPIPVGV